MPLTNRRKHGVQIGSIHYTQQPPCVPFGIGTHLEVLRGGGVAGEAHRLHRPRGHLREPGRHLFSLLSVGGAWGVDIDLFVRWGPAQGRPRRGAEGARPPRDETQPEIDNASHMMAPSSEAVRPTTYLSVAAASSRAARSTPQAACLPRRRPLRLPACLPACTRWYVPWEGRIHV